MWLKNFERIKYVKCNLFDRRIFYGSKCFQDNKIKTIVLMKKVIRFKNILRFSIFFHNSNGAKIYNLSFLPSLFDQLSGNFLYSSVLFIK